MSSFCVSTLFLVGLRENGRLGLGVPTRITEGSRIYILFLRQLCSVLSNKAIRSLVARYGHSRLLVLAPARHIKRYVNEMVPYLEIWGDSSLIRTSEYKVAAKDFCQESRLGQAQVPCSGGWLCSAHPTIRPELSMRPCAASGGSIGGLDNAWSWFF